ncbi:MAG: DnaA/Hda family protein [Gammaproteobacteria bacterium]
MVQELIYNQIPIDFEFLKKKTFDNFIIGNNEKLFHELANVSNSNQIILIYGQKSSGKTHICNALLNQSNAFNLFINTGVNLDAINPSDSYNLLVIDDLDQLISTPIFEEKLFTILNNQILNKKPAVITSSRDISECSFTLKDLSSRLLSDKIFTINELSDSEKIEMMISLSSQRGLVIPEKSLNYIINNCNRDLFFLCAFIRSLDDVSLSAKKRITIPFIKKVIDLISH